MKTKLRPLARAIEFDRRVAPADCFLRRPIPTALTLDQSAGRSWHAHPPSDGGSTALRERVLSDATRGAPPAHAATELEILREPAALAAIAADWDELVRATPEPSPYALHGWLLAWLEHAAAGWELEALALRRGGRLVAAAPLAVRRRGPLRLATLAGGARVSPKDVLVRADEPQATAARLLDEIRGRGYTWLSSFGVLSDATLVGAAGDDLHLLPRTQAAMLDLSSGWDTTFERVLSQNQRGKYRRKRNRLEKEGLEVVLLRTPEEVAGGLEEAFAIHDRRWAEGGDASGFTSPAGKRLAHASVGALAAAGATRLWVLRAGGQALAFYLCFVMGERMYGYRLGFDPARGQQSPGMLVVFDGLRDAAAEGVRSLDWGAGEASYKTTMSDGARTVYHASGLGRGLPGAAAARGELLARVAVDRARRADLPGRARTLAARVRDRGAGVPPA
jgi:CelD/BcsL family acetyltransferase involved in cellulose biosynthesis